MATMLAFYTGGVGLAPVTTEPGAVTLGLGQTPVVRLTEAKDLRPARRGEAGLFHTAVLFDELPALARTLVSMYQKFPETYAGTGDHLVSQAFYFTDPEGNGIELYIDRARSEWTWLDNQVQMATLYINPENFINKHLGGLDPDALPRRRAPSDMSTCRWATSRRPRPSTSTRWLRPDLRDAGPGALRQRRRLPPPHGDERLEFGRCRPAPEHSAWASSTSSCRPPTNLARPKSGSASPVTPDVRRQTLTALDPWRNELRLSVAAS